MPIKLGIDGFGLIAWLVFRPTRITFAEGAMARRVKQAVTDLRGNGQTMFQA